MKMENIEADVKRSQDEGRGAAKSVTWLVCVALSIVLAICLLAAGGCASLGALAEDERVQAEFDRAVEALLAALESDGGTVDTPPAEDVPEDIDAETPGADSIQYAALKWNMGGFNGSGALMHSGAVIGSLSVKSNGMSYKWVSGGCEQLGAADRGDHTKTLACLFYKDAVGKWQGGKFDWISTSRTTRDFKNIDSGYNGWSPSAFASATEYAFVIVGTNGRRTNVIKWAR